MKFSEIKKIISAFKESEPRFLLKSDIPFAIDNIEFFNIKNDEQFNALCEYVYNRFEAYINGYGKADAYDFCSAIEMNLEHYEYDSDASFKKKLSFLDKLDWAEVGRDADEILENF